MECSKDDTVQAVRGSLLSEGLREQRDLSAPVSAQKANCGRMRTFVRRHDQNLALQQVCRHKLQQIVSLHTRPCYPGAVQREQVRQAAWIGRLLTVT